MRDGVSLLANVIRATSRNIYFVSITQENVGLLRRWEKRKAHYWCQKASKPFYGRTTMVATRRLDIAYWLNFEDSLHTLHTSVQHKMFKQQWMYLARKRLCCCCHINSNWSSHEKSTQSPQCFRSDGRGATDHRCLKCPMLLTLDQNLKREGGHQTEVVALDWQVDNQRQVFFRLRYQIIGI